MNDALTIGGLVALGSLLVAIIALVVSALTRSSKLGERLTRLETRFDSHVNNGDHHA